MQSIFKVPADYGCLALVDPKSYQAFVGEDWAIRGLKGHLLEQAARERVFAWGCAYGNHRVAIEFLTSDRFPDIEAPACLQVIATAGHFILTDYDALANSAQYEDESLIDQGSSHLIEAPAGRYACRVVRFDEETAEVDFLVQLAPIEPDRAIGPVQIPWSDIP